MSKNAVPLLLYGGVHQLRIRNRTLVHVDALAKTETVHELDGPSISEVVVEGSRGFVSIDALRWLARAGVPLISVDWDGRLLSVNLPDGPKNPHARIAQMRNYLDPDRRLRVASDIVRAKVRASYLFLRKIGADAEGVAWSSIGAPRTIGDLLALEGRVAGRYFAALGIERSYPVAKDRTSAVLNYSYSLLAARCLMEVHRQGLDPLIGLLHEPQNYKTAFVYDLQEPYRWLSDHVALSVLGEVKAAEFAERWGFGVRLRESAARKLVDLFSEKFDAVESHFRRDVSHLALSFSTDHAPRWANERAIERTFA